MASIRFKFRASSVSGKLPDRSRYLHAVQEALQQDVPLADISEAMGHSTQRTTYIYLKSFENTPVDRANRKVLSVIA